jgi:hypothetical protein
MQWGLHPVPFGTSVEYGLAWGSLGGGGARGTVPDAAKGAERVRAGGPAWEWEEGQREEGGRDEAAAGGEGGGGGEGGALRGGAGGGSGAGGGGGGLPATSVGALAEATSAAALRTLQVGLH